MKKQTRSILEELNDLYVDRDTKYILESRANNVIISAIRLLEYIEKNYDAEQTENLTRKLLNSIRLRDPKKFTRSVRKADEKDSTTPPSDQ